MRVHVCTCSLAYLTKAPCDVTTRACTGLVVAPEPPAPKPHPTDRPASCLCHFTLRSPFLALHRTTFRKRPHCSPCVPPRSTA